MDSTRMPWSLAAATRGAQRQSSFARTLEVRPTNSAYGTTAVRGPLDARWMIGRHRPVTRKEENAMSSDLVKIESQHRRRLAVVYVRSSRVPQAPEDLAFVEYQRAQAWHARAWGWPESAVQVIDEDIGRAGRTTEARAGYQKLCDMVAARQVGMVLAANESRLARSDTDFAHFLDLCRQGDVLLAIDGHPMTPRDPTCGLYERMPCPNWGSEQVRRACMAQEIENVMQVITNMKSENRGETAVRALPFGFIRTPRGGVARDPHSAVRRTIRRIFRLFRATGHMEKVVAALRRGQRTVDRP